MYLLPWLMCACAIAAAAQSRECPSCNCITLLDAIENIGQEAKAEETESLSDHRTEHFKNSVKIKDLRMVVKNQNLQRRN
jgi:uncharacterized protein (DUF2225 family)